MGELRISVPITESVILETLKTIRTLPSVNVDLRQEPSSSRLYRSAISIKCALPGSRAAAPLFTFRTVRKTAPLRRAQDNEKNSIRGVAMVLISLDG